MSTNVKMIKVSGSEFNVILSNMDDITEGKVKSDSLTTEINEFTSGDGVVVARRIVIERCDEESHSWETEYEVLPSILPLSDLNKGNCEGILTPMGADFEEPDLY